MRSLPALLGLVALGACSTADVSSHLATTQTQIETLDLVADTNRSIDDTLRDVPFDTGRVYVVAEEHGELHTYSLTPCGGDHICGGTGHVGRVDRTQNYFVVTGAYRGRTFYLQPGGSGILTWRGENRDLAWN